MPGPIDVSPRGSSARAACNTPFDLLFASRDTLERMEVTARAAVATPAEHRALSLEPNEAVMFVMSTGYGPHGGEVLYMEWVVSVNMGLSLALGWPAG